MIPMKLVEPNAILVCKTMKLSLHLCEFILPKKFILIGWANSCSCWRQRPTNMKSRCATCQIDLKNHKLIKKSMKLLEHSNNNNWKVHELTWNLHETKFTLMWSHFTKRVYVVYCISIHPNFLGPLGPRSLVQSDPHCSLCSLDAKCDMAFTFQVQCMLNI